MDESWTGLEIDWQRMGETVQVTLLLRCTAADSRQLELSYQIDASRQTVNLSGRISYKGKRYNHLSVLRGFCVIPLSVFGNLDPESCDWLANIVS